MKRHLTIYWLILLSLNLFGQDPFVKLTDLPFGTSSRIFPAAGNGWVVFSSDSLRLSKFDNCGSFEWGIKYSTTPNPYGIYDFIRLKNGDYAYMHLSQRNNVLNTTVTRLDPAGTVIWSHTYGDDDYNHVSYSLFEDNSGNILVFGNAEHINLNPFYNMLMKLNGNGVWQWTRYYNHGGIWGGGIATSDGGYLLRTGDFIIKTNSAGGVTWTILVNMSSYYYLAPVEVSDGYIGSAYAQPSNEILFFKFDKQGQQLWGNGKTLNMTGTPPRLQHTPGGNLAGVFRSGQVTKLVELDKDLNIIKENTLDNTMGISGVSMNFLQNNLPVLTGMHSSGLLFYARLNSDYQSSCDGPASPGVWNPYPVNIAINTCDDIAYTFNTYPHPLIGEPFSLATLQKCMTQKFLSLGPDTSFCYGEIIRLENILNSKFDYYRWSTGDTTASINIAKSGRFILTAGDNCGEYILTDTIEVNLKYSSAVDLGPDGILCEGETAVIGKNFCDSCTYLWSTGDTTPGISVNKEGLYSLSFLFHNGCITRDSILLSESKCECELYLPKAFSPNSDNKNDSFIPVYYCDLTGYRLHIFNRWGQEVFNSDDPEKAWDGRFNQQEAKSDVYAYLLAYTPIIRGGSSKEVRKSGTIVLIR